MKTKQLILTTALVVLSTALLTAAPLGTAFTYQGRLTDGGNPANGSYDLTFTLYSAPVLPPTIVAGPLTNSATGVTNGLFTVTLDFGADVFNGNARWLGIGVRTNGSEGDFILLSPRQLLTPAPYALYAPSAGTAATASNASSVAATNITGTIALDQLPGPVVTNDAIGVNLSGAFSGNGAGLTILPPSVALLDANQTFTGPNFFADDVGIGSSSQRARLYVAGSGWFGFDSNVLPPSSGAGVRVFYEDAGGGGQIYCFNYGTSQATNLMLQLPGGNVGIGTGTPTAKLEVAGTVKATDFIGDGTGLTSLNAANVTGALGPDQVPNLDAGKITSGTLGTAQIPDLAAAKITSGTLADARLSANVALLNNSQTFSGAKTFSANVTATASLRLGGLLRAGSETGAPPPYYPSNPDGSTGLVIRRIVSTTSVSNSVVARTDQLTLVRDGTASGLNIVFAGGAIWTINATGITRAGNVVTQVMSTFAPPLWTVVFSDSQKVVHYDISFGDIYDTSHTCHVVLDRYDDGTQSDYYMVGTLTSTYNQ